MNLKFQKELWTQVSHTTNYLINYSTSKALVNTTTFELWTKRKPDLTKDR